MLELKFLKPYKSIVRLPATELPDFCIITGRNGSGKTHFFESMSRGFITSELPCAYYDWNSLRPKPTPTTEGISGHRAIESFREAWATLRGALAEEELRIRGILASIPGTTTQSLRDLYTQARDETAIAFSPQQKQQIVTLIENAQPFRPVAAALPEAARVAALKLPEPVILSNAEDFARACPLQPNAVDPFSGQIEMLFTTYYALREDNDLRQFQQLKRPDTARPALTDSEFVKTYGSPPWDVLNRVFEASTLPYRVVEPVETAFYQPRLVRISDGLEISPEDLSSGERVLTSLVFYAYALNDERYRVSAPKLLLLDEIDAPLHPSMAVKLLASLKEVIVEEEHKKVLLATHSPSTVALAPEGSIYVMDDKSRTLSRTGRDAAIRTLTAGVPVLSIKREHRRQIFVENDNDVDYYEAFERSARNHLDGDISLSFVPVGSASDGGSSRVSHVVKALQETKNSTVFGILDWDLTNEPEGRQLLVLGKGARYAVDHYILDPLLIAGLMSFEDGPNQAEYGLQSGESYTHLATLDEHRLQQIADLILAKLGWTDLTAEYVECRYVCGKSIRLPKAYVQFQNGHKLAELVLDRFKKLRRYGEEPLKRKLLDPVLKHNPGLVPQDVVDLFRQIQQTH